MLRSVHQLAPTTAGGRVVVLGTAFTALLLACMYTSSYTAQITVNSLKAEVSSMDDLIGLPVGIYEVIAVAKGAGGLSVEVAHPAFEMEGEHRLAEIVQRSIWRPIPVPVGALVVCPG